MLRSRTAGGNAMVNGNLTAQKKVMLKILWKPFTCFEVLEL